MGWLRSIDESLAGTTAASAVSASLAQALDHRGPRQSRGPSLGLMQFNADKP